MLLTTGTVSGINAIGSGSDSIISLITGSITLLTVEIGISNSTFDSITGTGWGGIIVTLAATGASSGVDRGIKAAVS